MATISTWRQKLESGHIFRHRYLVSEGKLNCIASGDSPTEAKYDANRLHEKLGLPLFTDAATVKGVPS